MKKIAVLASGGGTNFQSIIDHVEQGKIKAELVALISDKDDAFALERAKKHKIPSYFIDSEGKERKQHEQEIAEILDEKQVDLIVLAGYMRMFTPEFVKRYKGKMINIHPALLPSFPGTHGYEDAWNYGVKLSGCTVHFVDEGMDTGPIILQKPNPVYEDDTLESFKERGLKIEHKAFPEAINLFLEEKLEIVGRKVKTKP